MNTAKATELGALRRHEEDKVRAGDICFLAVNVGDGNVRPARVLMREEDFKEQVDAGFFDEDGVAVRFLDISLLEHSKTLPMVQVDKIPISGSRKNVETVTGLIVDPLLNKLEI